MREALQTLEIPTPRPLPERVLGDRDDGLEGPLLMTVAGMHGNELAGVEACKRVQRHLASLETPIRGRWLALIGNRSALAAGRRFIQEDLNRLWTPEQVLALRRSDPAELVDEKTEQQQLLETIEEAFESASGPAVLVDLHTTSGDGIPFAVIDDTLVNRRFAFRFDLPVILGFEEQIKGAALNEYLTDCGWTAVAFEGGSHQAESSIDHHEDIIWLSLEAAGLIERRTFPFLAECQQRLRAVSEGLPRAYGVHYRKAVHAEDQFRMLPGFSNFQKVEKGHLLACDRNGPIYAPDNGRLIMPLYQEQGDDGFFMGREFSVFWLHLSTWLRRLGLSRVAHLLPGVHPYPDKPGWMLVDPGIARWFVVEIFHLLGFRRHGPQGKYLVFSRRRECA